VTAFTLAHSVTLTLATLGLVALPSRLVESTIAASVVLAALNNVFPLVDRRLWLLAFGFGLVHGLGFAGALEELGLPRHALVASLLAFNVGVELAQLLTVALLFPSLYLASRTRFYSALRLIGASVALVAALGWALDRLGVLDNPLAGTEEALIGHPWSVVAGLALVAVACRLADRRPAASTPARMHEEAAVAPLGR
jgi:hypothetical protein